VAEQPAGEPLFDRVAIVRYPTRASFFAMQQREDFQELHVHKEAGMEFTILIAAEPPEEVGPRGGEGVLVLRVRRFAAGAAAHPREPEGVQEIVSL
jgi:hypothetical protein